MLYFEDLVSILPSIYLIFLFFQINTCTLYAKPIDESRCRIVVLWPSPLSKTRFQTLCMVFFIFFVIIFFPSQSQHTMRRLQEDFFSSITRKQNKGNLFFLINTNVFFKMGRITCARRGPTSGVHGVQRCGSSPAPAAGGLVHAQAQVLPAIRF